MSLELNCDCGTRPSPTDVWKDVPDTCEVCKKQVQVRTVFRGEKESPSKRGN